MKSNFINLPALQIEKEVDIELVNINGEKFFKISDYDAMRPFFMSIVSNSNHWMFISSSGGLSAGRQNAEHALFPYYTDDKITESAHLTGSKSIFIIERQGSKFLWEPFSDRYEGMYAISRNLYKNEYGNKIRFEEINQDLQISFSYQWNSSDKYGFVKKSELVNLGSEEIGISLLDGIQNIMPYGVPSDLQNRSSNLVDAYKRNQLIKESGLGIYALSAIIVDKAEPSEALKANVAWSAGLDHPAYLLSSLQLNHFRKNESIQTESDIKAERGAYFVQQDIRLAHDDSKEWYIVADVNKNHGAIARLRGELNDKSQLIEAITDDIDEGTRQLIKLNASADALQLTADKFRDTRHFANVLFNIMRGGIFDHNYRIEKWDFSRYLQKANKVVYQKCQSILDKLPEQFDLSALQTAARESTNMDFRRLCAEYMPLMFSRRHGDPSRPWNRFNINTRSETDGSKILDYEGNWRDIFQNWEALSHSFPGFVESMIHKFLNASTFDGYNPYRVTKGGFDWETIEPDNPWSYIGYWGDHQIIYLLKFLEFIENQSPGTLSSYFDKDIFVYANVPYKIASYDRIVANSKDTIDFDHESDHLINARKNEIGADGALLQDQSGDIYRVNLMEKLLASLLAKLSNFIPEGGIWLNTQRPEWNDANNALVGNGVSMVTLYYINRFILHLRKMIDHSDLNAVQISDELHLLFDELQKIFQRYEHLLSHKINDRDRKSILDDLGQAASRYRLKIYADSFSGNKSEISRSELLQFIKSAQKYLEHSIRANRRKDHLYHAYNLMTISDEGVSISYLSEMLEGQVAVLSSGLLSPRESLELLDGLKSSKLFREDQYSYILYPNKDLPQFTEKNIIPKDNIAKSTLLSRLISEGDKSIIEKDIFGEYHFNGDFKNAADLKKALDALSIGDHASLVSKETNQILSIFEQVFNHKAFTGRSGTFYGYEGLGSIYWHMVSKLQLAVQECCLKSVADNEKDEITGRLLEHYYEISEGIGVHKSPALYGAFPIDPYSHTPAGKGAQQPGMTGQVKEDIISRFGELGVFIEEGNICFNPCLLRRSEFLKSPATFAYIDVNSNEKSISLEKDSLGFTYCQIPIVYTATSQNKLKVLFTDKSTKELDSLTLTREISEKIFKRSNEISHILVSLDQKLLK